MFPTVDTLRAADVLVKDDAPWQAELRLRQARWREALGRPAGLAGQRMPGSRLPAGDVTSNFLTETVARAVQEAKQQPGALISAPRIYNNMLSSQPLTFNLFAELQDDLELASAVGRLLWPDLVRTVESIRFEWSPGRGDAAFLGNRSAFDVAWFCRDAADETTSIGIEVKYHENMTQDPGSPENPRYDEVAAASGAFRDVGEPALRALPLRQVWFDHLLSLSMVGDAPGRVARSRFVLLAPSTNEAVLAVDAAYRHHLRDAVTYERRTLEEFATVIASRVDAEWIGDFERRYLTRTSASDRC